MNFPHSTLNVLKSQTLSTTLGLTGLYLFAIFGWVDQVNNDISIFLMLLAAIFQYKRVWNVMRHEPLTYLFIIFTCYVLLHAYFTGIALPATTEAQWEEAGKWIRIWFFLIIAWWLDGSSKRFFWILALAFSGFILQVLLSFDWSNWQIIFKNQWLPLGLNKNATTLIGGIGLITIAIFLPRVISLAGITIFKRSALTLIALLLSAIFIEAMLLTQSRTAWIATTITLLILLVYNGLKFKHLLKHRNAIITLVIISTLLIFFLYIHHQKITRHFSQESKLAHNVEEKFDLNNIPYSSLGRRFHLWHFGLNRLAEKPFFGWGPGTKVTKDLGDRDYGNKLENKESRLLHVHPHLHNTYLITAVRLGIFGSILVAIAFVIFQYSIWSEYKKGHINKYIFIFYLASLFTFLFANMTLFRLFTQEDRTLIYLILGCVYSYRIASLKRKYL